MGSNPSATETIARLNDTFRQTLQGGQVLLTSGVAALPEADVAVILQKVRLFDAFNAANDPHGEHDFGTIDHSGQKIFFKIDYYDKALCYGSEDPADPEQTTRVMTILLAQEY